MCVVLFIKGNKTVTTWSLEWVVSGWAKFSELNLRLLLLLLLLLVSSRILSILTLSSLTESRARFSARAMAFWTSATAARLTYVISFIQETIYIHTYTHTYVHTYIHTNIHTYIHIHTYTYIHTHAYIYIHTHTHIYMCVYLSYITSGAKTFMHFRSLTYNCDK